MNILLLQTDIAWAQPKVNCKKFEAVINETIISGEHRSSQAKIDLVVLPEMFSTGFCTTPHQVAEKENYSLEWMKKIAQKFDLAICGSVLIETDDNKSKTKTLPPISYYNRFYFVMPGNEVVHYDKRHLFSFSGEDDYLTAGKERVIVGWRGWKFLLQTCYDLRFPIFSRNRMRESGYEYDAAIYVASWPISRISAWDTLLRARAIENQCYTIGVNRISSAENTQYSGHSAVIDYKGETVTKQTEEDKESTLLAMLDMEKLTHFREKFPTLTDADSFSLNL